MPSAEHYVPGLALIPFADWFPPIKTQPAITNRDELGTPQRREDVGCECFFAMLEVSYSSRDALAILLEDQPQLAAPVGLRIPIANDLDTITEQAPGGERVRYTSRERSRWVYRSAVSGEDDG